MSDTRHTATPWIEDGGLTICSEGARVGRVYPKIARLEVGADHGANMKFIVRACNSHADLLAACELCERIITEIKEVAGGWDSGANRQNLIVARDDLRAAIAKAKGEPHERHTAHAGAVGVV